MATFFLEILLPVYLIGNFIKNHMRKYVAIIFYNVKLVTCSGNKRPNKPHFSEITDLHNKVSIVFFTNNISAYHPVSE